MFYYTSTSINTKITFLNVFLLYYNIYYVSLLPTITDGLSTIVVNGLSSSIKSTHISSLYTNLSKYTQYTSSVVPLIEVFSVHAW